MKLINAWQCQYCGKLYKLRAKHHCANHETFCGENPNNRHACLSCKHLKTEYDEGQRMFYCPKIDEYLHTYAAEQRASHGAEWAKAVIDDTPRMPLKCEHYKNMLEEFDAELEKENE